MFIPDGGGVAYLQPKYNRATLALSVATGSATVEQMGVDSSDWFPLMADGAAVVLDASNTAVTVYAKIKLKITATGSGVRLYLNQD